MRCSPGKWRALAVSVGWPPGDEALDLGDGTGGELHARTLSLPLLKSSSDLWQSRVKSQMSLS